MVDEKSILRKLPKIDALADYIQNSCDSKVASNHIVLESCRKVIDKLRQDILQKEITQLPELEEIVRLVLLTADIESSYSLRPVINATGVVIHTNLGRAILSEKVAENVKKIASSYSTLEYSIETGGRGSRHSHIESLICKLTGAEAAMAVNNNAAAIMLALTSLSSGKEVIVSRGELVEIGGSFRIPEIMSMSGTILREVGTTNKTKLTDYKKAISTNTTAALLKVHTSNFKIVGFSEDVDIPTLSGLAKEEGIPLIYDLGSGLIASNGVFSQIGEVNVSDCIKDGVDVVCFSGDKLFGGPQAGIIAGRKKYIEAMKSHQLARVVRIDKLTLAALEATLKIYFDPKAAVNEIPVLASIAMPLSELEAKAKKLRRKLSLAVNDFVAVVKKADGQVGGGSAPAENIQSFVVEISSAKMTAQAIERELRTYETPIITRINKAAILIDVRTVFERDFDTIVAAFKKISGGRENE